MTAISRTLEHVGEWQVEVEAATREEVFVELAAVIARSLGTTRAGPPMWEAIEVIARDVPTLLADWVNELLGRSETAGRAYRVRNVRIDDTPDGSARIAAEIAGDSVDEWVSPLKAATYHGLRLEQTDGRWRAVLLLDV